MQTLKALMVVFSGTLIGAACADESDYISNIPLATNSSLSGDMFSNETEILTPRGIIDEPVAQLTLTHGVATEVDEAAEISPAAGPEVSQTAPVSPTTL